MKTVLTFHLSCITEQGTWKCKSTESDTSFEDVEFEDGEWTDYDEKVSENPRTRLGTRLTEFFFAFVQGGVSVSIMEIESQWVRA